MARGTARHPQQSMQIRFSVMAAVVAAQLAIGPLRAQTEIKAASASVERLIINLLCDGASRHLADQKCQMTSAANTVSVCALALSNALTSSESYQPTSGRKVTLGENQCCQPTARFRYLV